MDALLDEALRQAPEIMHHLFALNGSNKVVIALPTEEGKAAYVLRTIAAGLEEVGKAMGSSVQCPRPCDIEYHINVSRRQFPSLPSHITVLNFGHFEDLYLAAFATIKDYLQRVDTLLASNFKQPEEVIFVFPNEPLRALGPIRIAWLRSCMVAQQVLLESDLFTELLSRAIAFQAANLRDAKSHGMVSSNISSIERKPAFSSMMGFRQQDLPGGVGHLETIRRYNCGMIFALLTEKHGPVSQSPSTNDSRTPELPEPDQEIGVEYQSSSIPYNFDKWVNGLDISTPIVTPRSGHSKGPRLPLPTSDPSQVHLYPDASSKVYELDAQDNALSSSILGPTRRTYTGNHGGSTHQVPRKSLSSRKRCTDLEAHPRVSKTPTESLLIGDQPFEDNTPEPNALQAPFHHSPLGQAGMPPLPGSLQYYASTTLYEYGLDYLPLISPRVFSREELQQPFSKLCDTPPQPPVSRSIIGRRFFNFSRH